MVNSSFEMVEILIFTIQTGQEKSYNTLILQNTLVVLGKRLSTKIYFQAVKMSIEQYYAVT